MASPNKVGIWGDQKFYEPLSHGRKFSKEEIWENYTYFIKQVAPVAEENNVRIGIHPDDPPVPELAGVPRCIFANFEGYKRAMEIANSPNVGICLCCGCWNEGGRALMHKDPAEMIRYFGADKIWKIHFRNVTAPLPHFIETFMDNGYYDMSKIMEALVEVKFDGIVILDHTPEVVGGHYAGAGVWICVHEGAEEPGRSVACVDVRGALWLARVRATREYRLGYRRDDEEANCCAFVDLWICWSDAGEEPGEDDARADALLHVGLEGRTIPGWAAEAAGCAAEARASDISIEDIWDFLRAHGYNNQFEGGWQALHIEKPFRGRALTAQYMPIAAGYGAGHLGRGQGRGARGRKQYVADQRAADWRRLCCRWIWQDH